MSWLTSVYNKNHRMIPSDGYLYIVRYSSVDKDTHLFCRYKIRY